MMFTLQVWAGARKRQVVSVMLQEDEQGQLYDTGGCFANRSIHCLQKVM